MTAPWVEVMYAFVAEGKKRKAIMVLFREIDALLSAGEFGRCDEILAAIDLERLNTALLVGVLSITFPARMHLNERAILAGRIRNILEQTEPDRVEALMRGLE